MYNKNFNQKKFTNKNQYIRAKEVLVIDQYGNNIGVKETQEALRLAQQNELDLVEINPNGKPPVCKIIDYSKYIYEKNKKEKKNKATKSKELKELRFSPVIQEHDINVRVDRAKKFLKKGHNIKLTIFRKGRQTREQSREVMERLLTIFANYSTIEPEPKEEGRKLHITLKSDGQTKNKENSNKEDKEDKSEGQKDSENSVQKECSTSPKDKIIQKIKEKEATKGSST